MCSNWRTQQRFEGTGLFLGCGDARHLSGISRTVGPEGMKQTCFLSHQNKPMAGGIYSVIPIPVCVFLEDATNSLCVGASRSGIPAKEVFVPCSNGLDCLTFHINRTFPGFSVIAGHFGVAELEEAGISEYDCLFNIREPVARAISCLFYFYNELFQNVEHWSEDVFRRKATEEAVGAAVCHNDAARMLVSGMDDSVFLKANESLDNSSVLITKALSSLGRCVIVDLFPVSSQNMHWHTKAIPVIKAYFPWLNKGQSIPQENVSNTKLHRRPQRLPYRLIKELEKLNWVDMIIYQHALQLMKHQRAALATKLNKVSLRYLQEPSSFS